MKICNDCGRHVHEEKCVFCGGEVSQPRRSVRPILGERLSRAALVLGSALVMSSCGKKADETSPLPSAVEPKPEAENTPSAQTETPTPSPTMTPSSWGNTNQAEAPEPTVSFGPIPDNPRSEAISNEGPAVHYGGPPIRPRPDDVVHYGGPPMREDWERRGGAVYGGPDMLRDSREGE